MTAESMLEVRETSTRSRAAIVTVATLLLGSMGALGAWSMWPTSVEAATTITWEMQVHEAPAPLIFTSAHPHWVARMGETSVPVERVDHEGSSELRVFLDDAPAGLTRLNLYPLEAPGAEPNPSERGFSIPLMRRVAGSWSTNSTMRVQVGAGIAREFLERSTLRWEEKAAVVLPTRSFCGVRFERLELDAELVDARVRATGVLHGSQGARAELTLSPTVTIARRSTLVLSLDPSSLELDAKAPRFVADGTSLCDALAQTNELIGLLTRAALDGIEHVARELAAQLGPLSLATNLRTAAGPVNVTDVTLHAEHITLGAEVDWSASDGPLVHQTIDAVEAHEQWLSELGPLGPKSLRVSAPLDVLNALARQVATPASSRAWFGRAYPEGVDLGAGFRATACQLDAPVHLARRAGSLQLSVPLARCVLEPPSTNTSTRASGWHVFFAVQAPVQAGHTRLLWDWQEASIEPLCAPYDRPELLDRCDALGLENLAVTRSLTRALPASTPLDQLTQALLAAEETPAPVQAARRVQLLSPRQASGWVVLEFDWGQDAQALLDALELVEEQTP